MKRHIKVSLLFLIGLAIAVLTVVALSVVLCTLSAFSDGSGDVLPRDKIYMLIFGLMICSYFVTSIIGILVARKKRLVKSIAIIAHFFIILAYFLFVFWAFSVNNFSDSFFLCGISALIFIVYFLPWIALWFHFLKHIDAA